MRFPLSLSFDLSRYLMKKRLQGRTNFPLVLMLEPTHQCNLSCQGCGRIQEYRETLGQSLTLEECLQAVEDCGAPVVTVTGGEPLLYPPVFELLAELVHRRKHIYLCTNAILLEKSLPRLPRSDRLTLSIHMDGLAPTHDRCWGGKGCSTWPSRPSRPPRPRGSGCAPTPPSTRKPTPRRSKFSSPTWGISAWTASWCPRPTALPGSTMTLFMSREEIKDKFTRLTGNGNHFKFFSTPLYLSFLRGERDYECTPWANPTRNPMGWRAPCYQIVDTHYPTFADMMQKTRWEDYGVGRDPRCAQCMMHSGFEPSVVRQMGGLTDIWTMLRWNLS